MAAPLLSPHRMRMADHIEVRSWVENLEALAIRDTEWAQFGPVSAFSKLRARSTMFHRSLGWCSEAAELVPDVVAWFSAREAPPRLDVCPELRDDRLTQALLEAGLSQCGEDNWSRRVWIAGTEREYPVQHQIEPLTEADLSAFISVKDEVWPSDPATKDRRILDLQMRLAVPGNRFYFVREGEDIVAVAGMHLIGDVAFLNLGGVREKARGKGLQRSLLGHRLRQARIEGAAIATSLTSPDSASGENMRRSGMQVLCDREIWMPEGWQDHPRYRQDDR